MNSNCERIRRRALEHGEGSVEYEVWVRHSQHCEECRSEVYIQSLLRSDSESHSHGLSSEAVSRLVQLADERYRGGRRRHERLFRLMAGWTCRVAVFVLLVYGITLLQPHLFENDSENPVQLSAAGGLTGMETDGGGQAGGNQLADGTDDALSGNGKVLTSGDQAMLGLSDSSLVDVIEAQEALESARDYSHEPEVLQGWTYERRLQDCRRRIGEHRTRLYDSLESDVYVEIR